MKSEFGWTAIWRFDKRWVVYKRDCSCDNVMMADLIPLTFPTRREAEAFVAAHPSGYDDATKAAIEASRQAALEKHTAWSVNASLERGLAGFTMPVCGTGAGLQPVASKKA